MFSVAFALVALSAVQTSDTPLVAGRPAIGEMTNSGYDIDDCFVIDKTEPGPLTVAVRAEGFPVQLTVLGREACRDDSRWGAPTSGRWQTVGENDREAQVRIPNAAARRYVVQVRRRLYGAGSGPYIVVSADALDVTTPNLPGRSAAASSPTFVPASSPAPTLGAGPAPVSIMPPSRPGPLIARTQLDMGQPVTGALSAGGATAADCYYITTTNRYTPRFETIVRAEGFDAVVGVGEGRDCSAPVIWSDDNGGAETGGPTDARLEVTLERPGDYFIRVDRRGDGVGNYRVMAIVDGIFVVGAGLNSPMTQRHRTTMAAARERARTEVAGLTYAPPPRPSNWTGLSDGDVYEVISRKVDADPRSLTAEERTWVNYHSDLIIKQHLAGVPTWSSQNLSTEVLQARQQAAALAARPAAAGGQSSLQLGHVPPGATPEMVVAIDIWNRNVQAAGRSRPDFGEMLGDRQRFLALRAQGYFAACDELRRAAAVLGGGYANAVRSRCMEDGAEMGLERHFGVVDRATAQQAASDRRWAEAGAANAMRQAFLNPEVTVWTTDSSGRRTSQTMRYQDYQRRYVH